MFIKLPCKKYRLSVALAFLLLFTLAPVDVYPVEVGVAGSNPDAALFWAIEKDGNPAGYLLGTIHSEDPRVLDFSAEFLDKLNSNSTFAMEMVPDLPTLARLTNYMNYPPGQTLESVIGPERFKALTKALSVYNVPENFVVRMKPWAAMMALSTPPPQTGFFMDLSLSLRASGSGLKVVGLETLEQQLSFLENMPMPMQLDLLDQAIAEAGRVQQAHDEMVEGYLENNLQLLVSLTDEEFEQIGEEASTYFFEAGIVQRNLRMLDSLLPHLVSGTVFTAVGAMHLPGEDGLLSLLRQNGFELMPLAMPFNTE